ncbi:hypothetical protein DFH09DRAFT_1340138 [Mycena vulgaris]|nr:hypothetical protein DFH09DRAFT_1340138 [Mycena vulgaris]
MPPRYNVVDPVSLNLKREALKKGHMTTAFKIWLNPSLVDVKRMAAGRRRGYVSFYDRKIAQFKAREIRLALLMKQRAAVPKCPLVKLFRRQRVVAEMGQQPAKEAGMDATLRDEAELKEAQRAFYLRLFPLTLAYTSTMAPRTTTAPPAPASKSDRRPSAAATRIKRRRRPAPTLVVYERQASTPIDPPVLEDVPQEAVKNTVLQLGQSGADWDLFCETLLRKNEELKQQEAALRIAEPEPIASVIPEESDRARAWAWATAPRMCVDAMRAPDRRNWLDEQSYQESIAKRREERVHLWRVEHDGTCTELSDDVWEDYSPSQSIEYLDL